MGKPNINKYPYNFFNRYFPAVYNPPENLRDIIEDALKYIQNEHSSPNDREFELSIRCFRKRFQFKEDPKVTARKYNIKVEEVLIKSAWIARRIAYYIKDKGIVPN